MRQWNIDARELDAEDFIHMNLPERFYDATFATIDQQIQVDGAIVDNPTRVFISRYLEALFDMASSGLGVVFVGPNGTGKTFAACVLLKAFRMHGQSCAYAHAETFRQSLFSDDVKDQAGRPLKRRCLESDVLLLDDLGKEVKSKSSGHELYALEHLVRERYNRRKVTLYTSNMAPKAMREAYKKSTMSVIEGNTVTHIMRGENKRLGDHQDLRDFLSTGRQTLATHKEDM